MESAIPVLSSASCDGPGWNVHVARLPGAVQGESSIVAVTVGIGEIDRDGVSIRYAQNKA